MAPEGLGQSPRAMPWIPEPASPISSRAISENGRMPPIENRKSSPSGKASITFLVSRRWPCQCLSSEDRVITGDGAEVDGMAAVDLVPEIRRSKLMRRGRDCRYSSADEYHPPKNHYRMAWTDDA